MTWTNSRDDEEHRGRWKRKPRFSFDSRKTIRRAMTSTTSNKVKVVHKEGTRGNPKII